MNESTLTDKLIRSTKLILRGSEVIKLSDKATIGIPDLCINWGGATWWVEVKYLREGDKLIDEWKVIQRRFLSRLQQTTSRGLLFIYNDHDGEAGAHASIHRSNGKREAGAPGTDPYDEIELYDERFGPKRHALLGESILLMMHHKFNV